MKQVALRYGLLVGGLALVFFVVGCGGGGEASHDAHGGASTAGAGGDGGDIAAALAELSDEDRALAEKQKTCPISENPLGDMGKPYKLVLEGKTVFLCCSGCKEEAEEDVEATLAKVAEFVAANSGEGGE